MKRIFYISMIDITAFYWEHNAIVNAFQYSLDEAGQAALFRAIERDPHTPSIALVDIIEEEFHCDTIVHVSGADRKLLTQRKLKSHFRNTQYGVATTQGRSVADPKKDNLLISAITNPGALSLLLSWIQVYQVPLQGIYSVPYVSAHLIKKLGINQKHGLYVSVQKNHYLRLSYFQQQALNASRLVRISIADDAAYTDAIKEETFKFIRYLNRLQLLPQSMPLTVNIVCDSNETSVLNNTLESDERVNYNFLGLDTLAEKTHFVTSVNQTSTELLYAHVLANAPALPNYAQQSDRQYHLFRQLKYGLAAASIIIGMGGVTLSAYNILNVQDLHSQRTIASQRNSYLNQQLEQHTRARPVSRYSAEGVADTIILADRLEKYRFKPDRAYALISQELAGFSNIEIESLHWATYSSTEELPATIRTFVLETSQSRNALHPNVRVLTVAARLRNNSGNTYSAYQEAQRFVDSLKKNKLYFAVVALEMPVNTNSKQEVSGDISGNTGIVLAPLKVQLVLIGDAS